jgi:hypothetical protein
MVEKTKNWNTPPLKDKPQRRALPKIHHILNQRRLMKGSVGLRVLVDMRMTP